MYELVFIWFGVDVDVLVGLATVLLAFCYYNVLFFVYNILNKTRDLTLFRKASRFY